MIKLKNINQYNSDSYQQIMDSTCKTQTTLEKFEKFFTTEYKDDVFDILEKYPDERSLTVNYQSLEMFDPDLADLLIEKPEEVIEAAKIAIKNIDPLVKDADINLRFENCVYNWVPLKDITSRHIGLFIIVDGRLTNVEEPSPRIETGVFECRGCLRLHEVEQTSRTHIIEPSLCSECGGRSFKLLQEESKYIDTQIFQIGYVNEDDKTSRKLLCMIEDDLVSHDDYNIGQPVRLTGILKTFREEKTRRFKEYLYVNNIEFLDYPIDEELYEKEYGDRNSPEYREWQQKVINRDKGICQCCGSNKDPHAHHVYGYKNYPDLRVDLNNGITLCKWCHRRYHSEYGLKNSNPIKLMKFFNRFGNTSTIIINNQSNGDSFFEEFD